MAVYQISKIQLRRGKKNQATGMPQLASGEMAWAIDTQELFIGNGAVSEGAPYVGNTKILTDKDNILEIAAQYQYKYNSQLQTSTVLGTVLRPLQDKLDDGVVNARNFEIVPSSELALENKDQTEKLQLAINSIAAARKILEFDAGEYEFNQTLIIPSFTIIKGQEKTQTVFKFTGSGLAFDAEDMSESQKLYDFSIKLINTNSTCIRLSRVKNQDFKNLKLQSTSNSFAANNKGIWIIGNNSVNPNNKFNSIDIDTLTYGFYADNNSILSFIKNCYFESLHMAIYLKNASYFSIAENIFDNIAEQAVYVESGSANSSRSNRFKNVGMSLGNAVSSVIKFLTDGNSSHDDIIERRTFLENNSETPYVSDLEGTGITQSQIRKIFLPSTATPVLAFRLPLNSANSIRIDYLFHSTSHNQVRQGTINLVIDKNNNRAQLSDEYEFVGVDGENAVIFTADIETVSISNNSSTNIIVNYTNSNINDVNTFAYSYFILS